MGVVGQGGIGIGRQRHNCEPTHAAGGPVRRNQVTGLAAQSSAIDSPAPASSRRISGKPIPITDDGSPSTPSTNHPPRPSSVNPPATAVGSPLPTYASRSRGDGVPNLTVVTVASAACHAIVLSCNRTTLCPVYSSPEVPAICCHPSLAASAVAGLPRNSPSRYSIESQPITTQSAPTAASRTPMTASALAAASAVVTSPGVAVGSSPAMTASSSTPETRTKGSIPAWRNTLRRPADA